MQIIKDCAAVLVDNPHITAPVFVVVFAAMVWLAMRDPK